MVKLPDAEAQSMLRATLTATDHGLLMTGLDKQILAVNRRFGELFGIDPEEALSLGLEPLRERVLPTVTNSKQWMRRTDEIYADPNREIEDEIELFRTHRLVIHRFTSPVHDTKGKLLGRLWTYRDITRERRQEEMSAILVRLSSEFVPDPVQSLKRILKELKNYYGDTSSILSILDGDCMMFHAIETDQAALSGATQNALRDSFCQFALRSLRPLIIQDARLDPEFSTIPAVRFGLTRYLGVPVFAESSQPVGTLCILDCRSQEPLDDLDLNFLSFLGVRVAAELARERHAEHRMSEHRAQAEKQRLDLAETHAVLESMNSSFGLIWSGVDLENLLQNQVRLLAGVLGCPAAAVGVRRSGERSYHGHFLTTGDGTTRKFVVGLSEIDRALGAELGELEEPDHRLARLLKTQRVSYAVRTEEGVGDLIVAFGSDSSAIENERRRILLKALAKQVCLVIATHMLHNDLDHASRKLGEAQEQILQREKLAVVGTLAASTAHDIRNILSSISLLISPGHELDAKGLAGIREQIRRFDVLAHRLLSYAKPQMIVTQPVDLHSVVESVLAVTAGHFRVGKIKLVRRIERSLPKVAGDPHEYEHLLVNIILNGVQSMNTSGGSINLAAKRHENMVVVSIGDTGSGISDEIRDRLFEPFASTRSDGFGLGLYSCRRIVEHHGGAISARKNPKRGTTFTIRLPVYGG